MGRDSRCLPSHPSEAPDLLRDLIEALLILPPGAVYLVIGVLAAAENVFPPVPADTAVAVGAFLSTGGVISVWVVFAITWTANILSALGVYLAGRTIGRQFFRGRMGQRLLRPQAMQRLEALYEKYGAWGIFMSRFIPGVRAVVAPFAGIAGLGVIRAGVPIVVASGLWYGALTFVAARAIREMEGIAAFVRGLNLVGLGFGAIMILIAALVWWRVRRRRRMQAHGQDG